MFQFPCRSAALMVSKYLIGCRGVGAWQPCPPGQERQLLRQMSCPPRQFLCSKQHQHLGRRRNFATSLTKPLSSPLLRLYVVAVNPVTTHHNFQNLFSLAVVPVTREKTYYSQLSFLKSNYSFNSKKFQHRGGQNKNLAWESQL